MKNFFFALHLILGKKLDNISVKTLFFCFSRTFGRKILRKFGAQRDLGARYQPLYPLEKFLSEALDVTMISEQAFNKLSNVSLRLANETLSRPERQHLRVREKFNAKVTHKGLSSYHDIFVVKSLSQPLLGWPAIQALNLVHIVNNVGNGNVSKYGDKFPSLFQGL